MLNALLGRHSAAAAAAAVVYIWDSLRRVEFGFDAGAGGFAQAQAAYSVQADFKNL